MRQSLFLFAMAASTLDFDPEREGSTWPHLPWVNEPGGPLDVAEFGSELE